MYMYMYMYTRTCYGTCKRFEDQHVVNSVRSLTSTAGSESAGDEHILWFVIGSAAVLLSPSRERLNVGMRRPPLCDRKDGGCRGLPLCDRKDGGCRGLSLVERITAVIVSVVSSCLSLRRFTLFPSSCASKFGMLTSRSIGLLVIDTS